MKRLNLLLCFIIVLSLLSGCGKDNTISPEIKQQSIDLIHVINNAKENEVRLSVSQLTDILEFSEKKHLTQAEKDVILEVLNLGNSIEDIVQHKPDATNDFNKAYNKLKTYLGDF